MSFVTCVKWIPQGVAKAQPEKVFLNEDELRSILEDEKSDEEFGDGEDEYDMKNYSKQDGRVKINMKSIACFGKKRMDDGNDSEAEDENLKPDDNLILVGYAESEEYSLRVYVYNGNDGDFYIHHDVILNNIPLCVEFVRSSDGNLCAVGGMKAPIELWDLDVINCAEPIGKLGRCKKRHPERNFGHTEAIIDLNWSMEYAHVLASSSVDETVILWDMNEGLASTILSNFRGEVKCLRWGSDGHSLLTGCADKKVRLFDCRYHNHVQKWKFSSPIEKCLWLPDGNVSVLGLENGFLCGIDIRQPKSLLWNLQAHEEEVTGLAFSKEKTLTSCSSDKMLKIWRLGQKGPKMKMAKRVNGALLCLDGNPNEDSILCAGGCAAKRGKTELKIYDVWKELQSSENVKNVENQIASEVVLLEKPKMVLMEHSGSSKKEKRPKKVRKNSKIWNQVGQLSFQQDFTKNKTGRKRCRL